MSKNVLAKLTVDDLKQLQKLLDDNRNVVFDEIRNRSSFSDTSSSYLVLEKRKQLAKKFCIKKDSCDQLLETFKISDFAFFDRSLRNPALHSKKGDLKYAERVYLYPGVKEVMKYYEINKLSTLILILFTEFSDSNSYSQYYEFFQNPVVQEAVEKAQYLSYFEDFFQDEEKILEYESCYNTFLYLKSTFCDVVHRENTVGENIDLLFTDFYEKKEIVMNHFQEIATMLLTEKKDARISIFNHTLSKFVRKKEGTSFTRDQELFADAVAFGSALLELQEGNYEKAKQLIYVPVE